MSTNIVSMSEYVHYIDHERKEQWSALATIRGHSFPACMVNNGKKKSHPLLDSHEQAIKDEEGKSIEILSSRIGNKTQFNKCLKAHGYNSPLLWLTGPGEEAKGWYRDFWLEHYDKLKVKLDAPAITYIEETCGIYVPRRIMWNKHDAYPKDQSVFAGDKDVYRYMLAIVLENDIKEPAVEAGIAAANGKIIKIEKYISRIRDADALLADEIQTELNAIRKSLHEEVPPTIEEKLDKWSEKYLLPEILKSRLRVIRSGDEESDE